MRRGRETAFRLDEHGVPSASPAAASRMFCAPGKSACRRKRRRSRSIAFRPNSALSVGVKDPVSLPRPTRCNEASISSPLPRWGAEPLVQPPRAVELHSRPRSGPGAESGRSGSPARPRRSRRPPAAVQTPRKPRRPDGIEVLRVVGMDADGGDDASFRPASATAALESARVVPRTRNG